MGQLDGTDKDGAPPARTILVVEDDTLQRRVVVRLLARWDFGVVEAADGGEAVDRLRDGSIAIDAMILDIMLPVLDGTGVAREAEAARPRLPIVACSAAFSPPVEESLRASGVREFLAKPYAAEALRDILRRMTGRAPLA